MLAVSSSFGVKLEMANAFAIKNTRLMQVALRDLTHQYMVGTSIK